jgi:glutamine synthetase type III
MQKDGAGFAGFATWLDLTPAHPDLFAIPDASSVIQLPWKKDVAWVAADCVDGRQAGRAGAARRAEAPRRRSRQGASGQDRRRARVLPDLARWQRISDEYDNAEKPCYDQQALLRRYDVIAEICDYMLTLGWKPYQNDHEDANGQFEMNWEYDDALKTADKHSFFKFMVKSVAEKHGLRATFMPKPFKGLTGNGCHAHISVWDWRARPTPSPTRQCPSGLSAKGRNFLGGIMKHASALAAITNPTVNSYKRINAPRTISGATWAPNTVTWTGNNRTHMVRVPGPGRFELRLPDGAVNPYLLQAVIIAAGLDGHPHQRRSRPHYDIDMYAQDGHWSTDAPRCR